MNRTIILIISSFYVCTGASYAEEKVETKEKSTWEHSVFFELVGRTGAVEKHRHSGGITSIRKSSTNRLKLYASYVWARDSGVKTEDEYVAGIDDEYNLSVRTAWYNRVEYEKDAIEELRHRITFSTGIGYYFVKEDAHKLRGRLGAFWRDEDYLTAADNRTGGMELSVYDKLQVDNWCTWTTEIVYGQSFESSRDYRITYESKLELPFERISFFKVEIGVSGQYNNYTPGLAERYTTSYFMRLKFKW